MKALHLLLKPQQIEARSNGTLAKLNLGPEDLEILLSSAKHLDRD
jgi:hypothetical protein